MMKRKFANSILSLAALTAFGFTGLGISQQSLAMDKTSAQTMQQPLPPTPHQPNPTPTPRGPEAPRTPHPLPPQTPPRPPR